jgi:hypothetical protein
MSLHKHILEPRPYLTAFDNLLVHHEPLNKNCISSGVNLSSAT